MNIFHRLDPLLEDYFLSTQNAWSQITLPAGPFESMRLVLALALKYLVIIVLTIAIAYVVSQLQICNNVLVLHQLSH